MTATKTPAFHKPPLFTRQQLIALLLPLIAEQALSVTIGLADTLMVSSVGEAAVSGVSLVDSFNTLMIQIMSALATGGAVVASQYIGHREEKSARAAAAQIMFIMSSFSILVAAVVVVGRHAILRGIFGSIDADVMKYAETYFLLSALSYPFIGLYNAGAALFRAQGNSKISMMSSLGLLKYESILLLVLRLLYLQKRESLSASADQVLVTVEEVQAELQKMNLPRRLDQPTLEKLLRTLRRYNLARPVGRLSGLDSRIEVFPTVLLALPDSDLADAAAEVTRTRSELSLYERPEDGTAAVEVEE